MEIPSIFEEAHFRGDDGQQETIVFPGPNAYHHRWKDYKARWLRSLHINEAGSVLSCGMPKFFQVRAQLKAPVNGQFNIDLDDLHKASKTGLLATRKLDGVCLLRYVQNGQVKWRTRRNIKVGQVCETIDNRFEIEEFCKQSPVLNDPSVYPGLTIIFEWTSDLNQIVVKYDKPELTLIAAVSYKQGVPWYDAELQLLTLAELKEISEALNVPMVEHFYLNSETEVDALIVNLINADNDEGYVLRFDGEQRYVKIKSDWWIILAACKEKFTTNMAVSLWMHLGMPPWKSYQDQIVKTFGEDAWNLAMPVVSAMYDGIRQVTSIWEHIDKFVREHESLTDDEFEKQSINRFNMLRLDACRLLRKGDAVDKKIWHKLVLQNCKQMGRKIVESTTPTLKTQEFATQRE